MRIGRVIGVVLATSLLRPGAVAAQEGGPDGGTSPRCASAEHRQFDFWIGTWDVRNPDGRQVGTNTIRRVLGGCALLESWQSAGAHAGNSYNIYDATSGRWHQTWVDNGGLLLQLDGGLEGESMVLGGERLSAKGERVLDRLIWTPISADSVRQLWQASTDAGATWTTVFDGMYVRRK